MSDNEKLDPFLSIATMDDIIEELGRRSKHCLIVTAAKNEKSLPDCDSVGYWFKGGAIGALGLAVWVAKKLRDDEDEEDPFED